MKSNGGVAVLQAQDPLNNHPDNLLSAPNRSHPANSPSPNPNFSNGRRRTIKKIDMKNNTREFFAGSAYADSPPASSVPIPVFFSKNHDATVELRRILGLSLS
ncbi:hypothetical protein SSX86_009280 [Deinandra increscens subsp. villosa]|uniref:Uncharacterized protein n=1 Tax=Deinandra increscens subsp. villosa TaxID=3103831 RepID=A0AAP0DGW4_9ASTR